MNIGTRILFYLLNLYIFLLPITPSKYKLNNIPLNGDAVLALIIVIYLVELIIFPEVRRNFVKGLKDLWQKPLGVFMTIFIVMIFISISHASDKKAAIGESIRFSTYVAMYFIIKYQVNHKEALKIMLSWYLAVAALVSIIGISQYFRGIGIIQHTSEADAYTHIISTIENSNNLGMFLIFAVFPFIMLTIKERNMLRKSLYGLGTILVFAALIFTYSRNAWLGFALGCMVLVLIYSRKIIFLLLGAGLLSTFVPVISTRIKQFADMSQNISRIKIWEVSVEMIKAHPILGIGIGNFKVKYEEYASKLKKYPKITENYDHPHNALLKFQTETGIFGSISFIAIIVIMFVRIIKYLRRAEDQFFETFYQGFLASMTAFLCMNLIDNFFSAPKAIAFFWILIAVCEAHSYNLENSQKYYRRYNPGEY